MKLTDDQINNRLEDFPDWEYDDNAIHTTIEFENFREVFATMTRIAFECEKMDHHPTWTNTYNELEISLNTHDADGVTEKDFDLAAAIDDILGA
ncbi:4a-hydroxytetrahydrobiopterin dehydratase [Dokdonia sp. Hel_I_63]|jgi:4a-hydroxytetrahydrobiopterin dehydratase|uniref:4a-hydroxytetrahydrobiopterin dehydratase n=1 Tax=unclassified Dokdonia TaxID=2615033 RepID=UPI00020A7A59|nr:MULTISPECIES: 4a-hydroxytetrahydrobiopterin dehydratase [unclassified Dokdonia]AEE18242.1 transcriptional coactivator/pterin dehydratase [Dokdonia sp. 4H-3-7-5]AWH74648.1 4a-hydroxytetrahydrobiopterin dehydratase [Dokdonia sp. Dokd-P16]TVZ22526.1 4a-hydroxytetrahydrobiopterin dehydratase [Dokdonia sp. Hel_I_63]|tara:strand:- start:129053 stop:129334 length:282 start_codon:yes stop_codon:yes gene_type:complete